MDADGASDFNRRISANGWVFSGRQFVAAIFNFFSAAFTAAKLLTINGHQRVKTPPKILPLT
jgi:hypothetical protein